MSSTPMDIDTNLNQVPKNVIPASMSIHELCSFLFTNRHSLHDLIVPPNLFHSLVDILTQYKIAFTCSKVDSAGSSKFTFGASAISCCSSKPFFYLAQMEQPFPKFN